MVFLEFQLKFTKFGKVGGFPVTEHFLQDFQCRPWGGGWIFSGIAHQNHPQEI